jgi:PTS system galactitol-specific IIB component
MKKILLVCASGIATSTAVNHKLSSILDERGYKGKYQVTQSRVEDAYPISGEYDFCVSTTNMDQKIKCPVALGVAFLTGRGQDAVVEQILGYMDQE